jgi:hypothetical protein
MEYVVRDFDARVDMIDALNRYINDGVPLGDFLYAVVTNNLSEAVSRADRDNLFNLPALVIYLYNEAPMDCWGSKESYESWIAYKREKVKE